MEEPLECMVWVFGCLEVSLACMVWVLGCHQEQFVAALEERLAMGNPHHHFPQVEESLER